MPPPGSITSAGFDMNGAIAGGQIGYNWQSSNWVFGLEADAAVVGREGQSGAINCAATLVGGVCLPGLTFLPAGATGTSLAVDQNLEWFGTVRGRAGMLATPQVLFYATGGLAYGSIKTSGAFAGFNANGVAVAAIGSNSDIRVGWTVGAGIEGKITSNWSAKLEYLYMDFDSFSAATLHARAGQPDQRQCGFALPRPHPARRHELHLRRPGDREVLISALSSSRQIKAPASSGAFLLCRREKGCGRCDRRRLRTVGRKRFALAREPLQYGTLLEHDPEKLGTGFPKGSCSNKKDGADDGSKRRHHAP